jgi:hypothetical protein
MKTTMIGARLTSDEIRRLDRLAKRAGLSRSAALRALVGAADDIRPQPARVSFVSENNSGAGTIRQDETRAAVPA